MMKTWLFKILPVLFILFSSISCNQNLDISPEPSKTKLVIFATLDPDSAYVRVLFSRTSPIENNLNKRKIEPSLTSGWIECEGVSYSLYYDQEWMPNGQLTGYSSYLTKGLQVEPGKTYTLHALSGDQFITSTTYIPMPATINIISIELYNSMEGIVVRWTGNVTSGTLPSVLSAAIQAPTDVKPTFKTFSQIIAPLSMAEITTDTLWSTKFRDSLTFSVMAMDSAYYAYSMTQNNATLVDPLTDISFPTRGPAAWNIQGDGIGLFIGRVVSKQKTIIPVQVQP